MTYSIRKHEGSKYIRQIWPCTEGPAVEIDVYCVLEAFAVTCPARQHAIKKLLCAGIRGKGNEMADLQGALAALQRAIELQHLREQEHNNDSRGTKERS